MTDAADPADPTRPAPRARPQRRLGMTASSAAKATVVSLVVYSLLASGALVRSARGQDDGVVRDVSLPVAQGVDRVANFLSLNRPYDWAAEALGREDARPERRITFPPPARPPLNEGVTTTTFPPPPEISPARPMRIMTFGDSLAIDLGKVIQQQTAGDPLISADYDGKVSSGLSRQDFYNWPERMIEKLNARDADVVVIQMGANDDKSLTDPSGARVATFGTPEWDVEYQRRIAGVMDLLNNRRRRVVWVGNPVVRRESLNPFLAKVNSMIQTEAATRHDWVTYVPTDKLLAGPNGEYVDYLTPAGGAPIRCRVPDGIHPTFACDRLVADQVLAVVRPIFPVATTVPPTTVPPTTAPPTTAPPTTVPPTTVPPTTG